MAVWCALFGRVNVDVESGEKAGVAEVSFVVVGC